MLTNLLHKIVARPWVYDRCQFAVGATRVRRRLAEHLRPLSGSRIVLDIGGGTGAVRQLWRPETRYVCLDIDPLKLEGYVAKNPGGLALLADATCLPVADGSVDVVLCTLVTHHLSEPLLGQMLAAAARAIKPTTGRLVLLDAVWRPWRLPSRLLWRFDRGSNPRLAEFLRAMVEREFDVETWDRFAALHEYFVCVATPRNEPRLDH